MLRFLFVFVTLLTLSACDSCRRNASTAARFAPGAEKAAALPWRAWSAAVLADAARENKPVVISLSGSPCEWCDVLDTTTLSNDRTAELLRTKFILVRAAAEEAPELVERFGAELPRVIALDPAGNAVWDVGYVQPTPFNQGLFKVLRGENPVLLPRYATRNEPRPAALAADMPLQYAFGLVSLFDNAHRGYESPKALSIDHLWFDLLVGASIGNTDARGRVVLQLDSAWAALRDPVDGGFLTGSANADWMAVRPEKFAVEQARMASVLATIAQQASWRAAYSLPVTAYVGGAEQAVAYLRDRLVENNRVAVGEAGTPAYYAAGKAKRALEKTPMVSKIFDTATAGRTAAALADAARRLGRDDWSKLAADIATHALRKRSPQGLFYHLPDTARGANRLADATAMLEACNALYAATAEERWIAESAGIVEAMGLLHTEAGYFVAATDTVFPPEAPLALNVRAAEALWYLGVLRSDISLREAAFQIMEQFGASPPGTDFPVVALAVWRLTGPVVRLELPRAWRTLPQAAALVRHPGPFGYILWTDRSEGRVCSPTSCQALSDDPAVLATAAAAAMRPRVGKNLH